MSERAAERRTLTRLLGGGARQVGAFFASMFVLPVIAHFLDGERMGAWALLGAAGFLIGFVDLGLATSVQRAAVTNDHERTQRMVGLSLSTQLVLLPFAFAAAWLYFADIPGASAAVSDEARRSTPIVLCGGAMLGLGQPYRMFVLAKGGVRAVANARTFASTCQIVVLAGGFFWLGPRLLVPAIGLFVTNTLDTLLTVRAARALDPGIPLLPRRGLAAGEIRSAYRDGAAAFFMNLAVTTALRIDLFVLNTVAPLSLVGTYQVAGRAIDMAYIVGKQATVALMPELGDPEHRGRAVRIGTGVFAAVVVSGMVAVASVGQPFLVALFDEHAAGPNASLVLALLGTAAMIMSLYEVASSMVMLGGKTAWDCALPIIVGALLNLCISIGLAPTYGVWAVAGSTVAGNFFTLFFMWSRARRLLAWSLASVLRATAPALVAAPVAAALGLALRSQVTSAWWSLLAALGVTLLGVLAAAAVMRWTAKPSVHG